MAAQILETKNYRLFGSYSHNRDIGKTDDLEKSMQKYGWLDAYPAHVVREGTRLKVKAGHHRITVAARLGIPVKYVICDDGGVSIYELEHCTSSWTLQDFLDSHCRSGLPDYLLVRKYSTEDGVPLSCAIALLSGMVSGKHMDADFKNGTFRVKTWASINIIVDILRVVRSSGAPCGVTALLVQALARMLFVREFSPDVLKKKIKAHSQLLRKQVSLKDYMAAIEMVYNRQNKDKVQLQFLAEKNIRAYRLEALKRGRKRKAEADMAPSLEEVFADAL